jgi:hypothetical protein
VVGGDPFVVGFERKGPDAQFTFIYSSGLILARARLSPPKRRERAFEKISRLAFFITAQCLREANELAQRVLWIIGHYRPRT